MKRLYLAGKISGTRGAGGALFATAAAGLRARGFEVYSPVEAYGTDRSKPFAYYMERNYTAVLAADGVAVLPNWKRSNAARSIVLVAQTLEKPVVDAATLIPVPEQCWSVVKGIKWQPNNEAYAEGTDV